MQLIIKKEDLSKGLQTVQKVAQNKSNNLTHENGLLIKAINENIEIQANDYDMGIKVIIPGLIKEPGEVFISNPFLTDLVRRIPSDSVTLTKKEADAKLILTGGKSKFEFLTMNPDDFTEVEIIGSGYSHVVTDSITLKNLIDNTSYACAADEARPIFTGILLDARENTIIMVGTDTHRLALKKAPLEQAVVQSVKAVIPSRMISEISRQLPVDMPQPVEITAIRNNISFKFGDVYINTRLIEGEYPNYERVIPKGLTSTITTSRSEFTGAVERASIIAKDSQYNVIHFVFEEDQIKLTSQHPDYGIMEDYSSCIIEGDSLAISFNGKYILDFLKHSHGEEIVMQARENSPMIMQEKGDDSYVYVVTPMRVK